VTKITFQIIAVIFLLLLLPLHRANAQQDVASLTGEETDSSGAQVADATVKIVDTRTGSEIETKTEGNGSYRFLRLQPGPGYTLTVTKDGFQTSSITNLYLAVATTRTQNVQLEVGGVNQTVEVTSEGSVTLNTTDSTIGNNFDLRAVGSLPIEFRDDPSALLRLQPGVVNAQSEQTGANSASDPSGSRDGSVAGARADQNNITVDGIDATDFAFGQSFRTQAAIPVEAVQEFSTQVADITPPMAVAVAPRPSSPPRVEQTTGTVPRTNTIAPLSPKPILFSITPLAFRAQIWFGTNLARISASP
jgi:Carboxypeptidase regulatory-like domain